MQFRTLGRSGLKVTTLCLGTMAFGRWIDEAASALVIDAAFDAGINFFDTANIYGRGMDNGNLDQRGESETILGNLLGARRERIVLATKAGSGLPMGPGPNDRGLNRRHIMEQVENSLRRLKTDYIDLYQCHAFDESTPIEETMRALDDLVRQGKVRYIGCSNWAAWQVAKANGISEQLGLERFVSIQPQYSLLVRDVERELAPYALSEGVGIIPYSPMARGLLTGKYRLGELPPEGSRAAANERRLTDGLMTDRNFRKVEGMRTLCAEWDLPMARVATAWVLANPAVTSAIVGASKPGQVADAVVATELQLTPEQKLALDQLASIA
jgi:aryl-alcohol dehydrogenase-like predicted oxidoreductase